MDENLKEASKRFLFPRNEVGTDTRITFYMYNNSEKWPIVDIDTPDLLKELKVDNLPQVLKPKQKQKCELVWSTPLNMDDAFATNLDVTGELQIG